MQKSTNALGIHGKSSPRNLIGGVCVNLYKSLMFITILFATGTFVWGTTVVNVTNPPFNARGDGNTVNPTNNRVPIQNAIDSLGSQGGTVYFPNGLYNVHGTIFVPSNVRLQGFGSEWHCQIRQTLSNPPTPVPLFEVMDGATGVIFKDLTLYSNTSTYPRSSESETEIIRNENTTGISLKAGSGGISNIVIENVRIARFTYGVAATSSIFDYGVSISDVKIRNYASDGNEYALYTNSYGADNWDVQNMNAYPMYYNQNGIFLERSGKMQFLQFSCAGVNDSNICARLWDNGDTYFRNMHVEGPRLGFCVGTDCDARSSVVPVENNSLIWVESSATNGDFHRSTNLVSIGNRFYIDPVIPPYRFFGSGENSSLMTCGDVWVSVVNHFDTRVGTPPGAFPGLSNPPSGCLEEYTASAPTFEEEFTADNERLTDELNVTSILFQAIPDDGLDDTQAFQDALDEARLSGNRRIFVPSGTFDINGTLELRRGETIIGESGSVIRLSGVNHSLFKIKNDALAVNGITLRNLTLTAVNPSGTVAIEMENHPFEYVGAASDFQIQNLVIAGFGKGIYVHPLSGYLEVYEPMFDSVSIKDVEFIGNDTAIHIKSRNASHWNINNITVEIPNGEEGVRIDGAGGTTIRKLNCTSPGTGSACLIIQRQGDLTIEEMTASNVTNALVVPWENGWTQFPVVIRNSDLQAGVYFQGKIYLISVGNTYPADFSSISPPGLPDRVVLGALYEGSNFNIAYGEQSDIFSCNDTFRDPMTLQTLSTWDVVGNLITPVTYCTN